MSHQDEDLKYKEIINILKGLPKVNAPKNFETVLMRRINQGFSEEKKTFRERFLSPSRLFPSAALAVSAVLMLFVLNQESDDNENLLFSEPRMRKDFPAEKTMSTNDLRERLAAETEQPLDSEENIFGKMDQQFTDSSIVDIKGRNIVSSVSSARLVIDKEGLNFRRVILNKDERLRLDQLKAKVKTLLDSGQR